SGTYTINPSGSASATNYKSITSAISDLTFGTRPDGGTPNGAGVSGAVILELASGYTSGSETFPLTFGTISGVSSTNTITVRPASNTSSARSITSSNTTATINLNGCNYIIFDGRPGGTGTNKRITISNTSTIGVALQYINDASNNIVKHCNLRGENTDTIEAVVLFSTTTGTTGNDNNTIDSCEISEEVTIPNNAIYSAGTLTKANSGNTISNCKIYNFFSATLASSGIFLDSNNEAWNITGNHFYQTATRTVTIANTNIHRVIYITSGSGYLISNNIIGGGSINAGGTAWTQSGSVGHRFIAIDLSVDTTTVSSVQGNTIANFLMSTSNGSSGGSGVWCGINITGGNVDVGTISSNTIGNNATGSINVTTSGSGGTVMGMCVSKYGLVNISNNKIGSITSNGTSTAVSCSIFGIYSTATGTLTISGNTIGHATTANSLNVATSSTANIGQHLTGISHLAGAAVVNITNNIIANLKHNYNGSSTSSQVRGIVSGAGVNTITGNTIRNLTTNSTNAGASNNSSVIGISFTSNSSTGSQSVSENVIHTLANTSATTFVNLVGIYATGPSSGTHFISRNFIHSLNISSSSTSCDLIGILAGGGTGIIYQNNMIRLGINESGANITKGYGIYGIAQNQGTNLSFYHNSVYIGGTGVSSSENTAAFYRSTSGTSVNLINNILVNARSNSSGSASNAAIWISNTTDYTVPRMISNHNILHTPGTGGIIGLVSSTKYPSLALWQDSTSLDTSSGTGNPVFVNATGNASAVNLRISGITPAEGYGSNITGVTHDFDGGLRSDSTAVDIGADAGNFTAIDAFLPQIYDRPFNSTTGSINNRLLNVIITDIGSGVPTSGANRPRIWYRRSAPSASVWVSTQGTLNSGTGNNGNWSFTIDYSALSITPSIGETYQYYVVAQDQASTPNLNYNIVEGASHTNVNTRITAPTTPQSFTIIPPLGTTINVGTGQTYTTLTGNGGLFAIIDSIGLNGNTIVNITSDLSEPGIKALTGVGLSGYTLTIQPSAASLRTISNGSNLSSSMLRFDEVTGIMVDGRSGGSGQYLRIVNTHTTASNCRAAIEIRGSSTNTTIRNCLIETNTTSDTLGNIWLSSGTNTGISIRNNDIRNAQGTPGTVGIPRHLLYSNNASNAVTVADNNIYNFTAYGINLKSAGNGCNISGNSVYYNASAIPSTSQVGIYIGSGNNQTISGNYIGGQSSSCGGSPWTSSGNITFKGIEVNVDTVLVSSIQNNTIANFSMSTTNSTNTGSGIWCGINIASGNVNVGTSSANTIGNNSNGSISVTTNSSTGTVLGMNVSSSGLVNISNNNIGSITTNGASATISGHIVGIRSTSSGNLTISGNTIGHASTVNSLNASNPSTSASNAQFVIGIIHSTGAATVNILNNIIANLNNNQIGTGSSGQIQGIVSSAGMNTITGNTIRNLNTTSAASNQNSGSSVIGISLTSAISSGSQSVSQNVIHSLSNNTTTNSQVRVLGIYVSGITGGTHQISRNFIHSLNNFSTSYGRLLGIEISNATGITFQNNMIRLGIDASGNSITRGYPIYGIYMSGNAGSNLNFYHNSIYIGGSGVAAAGINTVAFYRNNFGSDFKLINNIFVNARSNSSGPGYNASIYIENATDYTTSLVTSNYNILHAPGVGGVIGLISSTAYTSLPSWNATTRLDTSSGSASPGFINATGNASTVDLHISGNTPVEGYGSSNIGVTNDYDGELRSSLTAVDIGADAGNFTAVDAFFPQISFTPFAAYTDTNSIGNRTLIATISNNGAGLPISGVNRPRIWYRRSAPTSTSWASTSGTLTSGNGNNGTWSFTIDYSNLGITPTNGEIYQYYVVAQDQASSPNLNYKPFAGALHTNVNTQTTAPTAPNSYTVVTYAVPSLLGTNINVGSGQAYTTLTGNGGLFAAINSLSLTGNTTVNITSNLSEPGTHELTGAGLAGFTLTIKPSADSTRVISNSANLSVSMLRFNGVTGLSIDGRSGGSGQYLRIVNTHTTAASGKSAIEIFGSSTNSIIRNCKIETNSDGATTGRSNILIGLGTNIGIIIRNNDIRDAQGTPGTVGIPSSHIYSSSANNVVSIVDNNLYNFSNRAINLSNVGDSCVVSGNSVYYNSNVIANTQQTGIYIGSGSYQTIIGNYIGGQSPNCGGGAWINSGNTHFAGISLRVGKTIASSVQGNTIQNINLTGTGTVYFKGINIDWGTVNIGTATGNLIGHPTTINSITNSGSNSSYVSESFGIHISNNNTVVQTIVTSNNTIANITNYNSTSSPTQSSLAGIVDDGYMQSTYSNNTIYNLSTNAEIPSSVLCAGILLQTSNRLSRLITNNTIYNLSNTNIGGSQIKVYGIYCIYSNGVCTISQNRIYGLNNNSSGQFSSIRGIYLSNLGDSTT
ncbi:MAG: hypothetical protein ACOVOV_02945, partial [Dolichospermum sp.]